MPKAILNWSGGKDSAMTLYELRRSGQYEIKWLLTSVSREYNRISMHGVRVELLEYQAQSLDIPLHKLMVPQMPSMEMYDNLLRQTLVQFQKEGIECSIFGDIFLEDLRAYREQQLAKVNMRGVFPIWKRPTDKLVRDFIDLGFKAILVCINDHYLDRSFVGRMIDHAFLRDLPVNVDPCGENGEFHSFVFDGPIFKKPVPLKKGEIVYKKYEPTPSDSMPSNQSYSPSKPFDAGFWYCDLLLDTAGSK